MLKKYFMSFFFCMLMLSPFFTSVNAQCGGNTRSGSACVLSPNYFGELNPIFGTTNNSIPLFSPGNYFKTAVLKGGCYTVSTCGASIDTQIGCFQNGNTTTPFAWDDDDGPDCTGINASINITPNFSGYANFDIRQYSCLPGGSTSIPVSIRQNNNLVFTSSSANMCEGETRTLSATPAPVTSALPSAGDPGTFSGTGVIGNIFTAPTFTESSKVFTIAYTFGYVTAFQNITVYQKASTASVVSTSITTTCNATTAVLNAISPTIGTGAWSVSSGPGSVTDPANPKSDVTGLSSLTPTVFRWTVVNGPCSSNFVEVTVTTPPSPSTPSIFASGPTSFCKGGSVTLDATDADYTSYSWNPGGSTEPKINVTEGGSYSVTVTNASGCSASSNATIVTVSDASSSDIYVTICNAYTWKDSTYKMSGDYTFDTLNAGGCDSIITLHLTITSINSTYSKVDAGCNGSLTGSITVTPTNGDGPYIYKLGTKGSFSTVPSYSYTFNNLKGGKYRITIIDSKGCQGISDQVVISQQPAVTASLSITNPTCSNISNGSITVTPTNSNGPYQYRLGTTGSFGPSNTFTGLRGGFSYRVSIQDGAGCVGSLSTSLVKPTELNATFSKTDESCPLAKNGSILVNATGGTSPYRYAFGTTGVYAGNNSFTGLGAANYRIFVKDRNNCTGYSIGVIIGLAAPFCTSTIANLVKEQEDNNVTPFGASLYPNPSHSSFTLIPHSIKQDLFSIRVVDISGKVVFSSKGNAEQSFRFGAGLPSGLYMVEVRQGDQVKIIKAVKVNK